MTQVGRDAHEVGERPAFACQDAAHERLLGDQVVWHGKDLFGGDHARWG